MLSKPNLDRFPDGECPGTKDVTTGDIVILHHLCLGQHLNINIISIFVLDFTS